MQNAFRHWHDLFATILCERRLIYISSSHYQWYQLSHAVSTWRIHSKRRRLLACLLDRYQLATVLSRTVLLHWHRLLLLVRYYRYRRLRQAVSRWRTCADHSIRLSPFSLRLNHYCVAVSFRGWRRMLVENKGDLILMGRTTSMVQSQHTPDTFSLQSSNGDIVMGATSSSMVQSQHTPEIYPLQTLDYIGAGSDSLGQQWARRMADQFQYECSVIFQFECSVFILV